MLHPPHSQNEHKLIEKLTEVIKESIGETLVHHDESIQEIEKKEKENLVKSDKLLKRMIRGIKSIKVRNWIKSIFSYFMYCLLASLTGLFFVYVHYDAKGEEIRRFEVAQLEEKHRDQIVEIKERIEQKKQLEERVILAITTLRLLDEYIETLCKTNKAIADSADWVEKRYEVYSKYISVSSLVELTFSPKIYKKVKAFLKKEETKSLCSQNAVEDSKDMRLRQAEIRRDIENNIKIDLKLLEKEQKDLQNLQKGGKTVDKK